MDYEAAFNYFLENESYEYIIETNEAPDFLEIVSYCGGDYTKSRVYEREDGYDVFEK